MPEGPEVLTIVDQLDFLLNKCKVTSIDFFDKYESRPPNGYKEVKFPLIVDRVFCKGKQLVFEFSEVPTKPCNPKTKKKLWMFNHLRMTGKWSVENQSKEIDEEHMYARINVENNLHKTESSIIDVSGVVYSDVRGFGTFEFITDENEKNKRLKELANGFIGDYLVDYKEFETKIKKQSGNVVTKLTDQKVIVSGIGNYLISEILYDSGIYPFIKCESLDKEDIKKLYESCKKIITSSYNSGGMSMKDYVDVFGKPGDYEKKLCVYMRKTDSYGNKVVKTKRNSNQNVWFVPGLQKKGYEDSSMSDDDTSSDNDSN